MSRLLLLEEESSSSLLVLLALLLESISSSTYFHSAFGLNGAIGTVFSPLASFVALSFCKAATASDSDSDESAEDSSLLSPRDESVAKSDEDSSALSEAVI